MVSISPGLNPESVQSLALVCFYDPLYPLYSNGFSLVIHIDTIDIGLFILYFKGSPVEVSEL